MAATAVYIAIVMVPKAGRAVDAQSFSNINATTAGFPLQGGEYGIAVVGSTFGTVTVQALGPDGATWLQAVTPFTANSTNLADLPPGVYRVALS